jgi:hypothetical protein
MTRLREQILDARLAFQDDFTQRARAPMEPAQRLRAITPRARPHAGMAVANAGCMAAVMALVFLFAFASSGLMLAANAGSLTVGTVLAMGCFVALATGVFLGTFIQARKWEEHDS